jgi:hypothetical protein
MPRAPDGRTVLTEPEAHTSCNGSVGGHRGHLPPFIPDTNPIQSTFATVKLRTQVTNGAGSKDAALAMAYKLLDAAQARWRIFNAAELVKDLLHGATFKDGIKVTHDRTTTTDERVAA